MAASVRAKLLKLAKEGKHDFQMVLTRYALERLLYRLSISSYVSDFIVKGAILFTLWMPETMFHRATKDLDLLGYGQPSQERLESIFCELCQLEVPDDGLVFEASTIKAEPIRAQEKYSGIRVHLNANLSGARIPLQIDIGFGDSVDPPAEQVTFPTLLPFDGPQIRAYRKETQVAEKFHAMVERGLLNSRLKDYFDIMVLARTFSFDAATLWAAISSTFQLRETVLGSEIPMGLTQAYAEKQRELHWKSFTRKKLPPDFEQVELPMVIEELREFLWTLCQRADSEKPVSGDWPPGGPWNFGAG